MTKRFTKGDWTTCNYAICEIWDNKNDELCCTVGEKDADFVIGILEENEQLKKANRSTLREFEKGVEKVQKLAKENEQLKKEVEDLKQALIRCAFDER